MTRFLGTPLKGEGFSSSSDEAFSARVAADTQPRIRIDAGGRITWGGGSAAGDVYVYRYGANTLKFEGNVAVNALFVDGIEIDTTGATNEQILRFNGTKFLPYTNTATVNSIDDVGDVIITSVAADQFLKYNGTNWVNTAIIALDIPTLNQNTTGTASSVTSAAQPTITSVGTLTSLAVTNGVTAATFTGALTGNASTVTTNANLTGGVTSVGNAATVVTNANLTGGVTSIGNAATVVTNANLTGDVTSIGNATAIAAGVIVDADINASAGIVDTKLATIATAGKVSNSATTAASANTASAIVARDASGDFTAGTITAALTGNASTASAVAAANLTGATLASGVTGSSLTSVGTLGSLAVTGGVTAASLTLSGNLIVNGSTTTVNSTVTTLDDPVLTLGGDTAPSSDDNKDRGVEFRYHNGAAPKIGFFGYDDSSGRFIMIPDATNTSEVFSGTVGDIQAATFFGALSGNASTATTLQNSRTIQLTGDVTGSASFDGSANASITATIAANSVSLGTDTTGDYMVNVSAGTGITVSHTQGEGSTATVSLNAGIDTLTDVTITSATTNDFLKYNGSAWVNEPIDLSTDTTGSYVQSLVAGTGVTITNNSGEGTTPTIAIGQAVATSSNVTFNDVTVAGNLNVTGSTFGSATLNVDNYKITLNAAVTGAPSLDGEIEVNRGTSPDVRVRWNESSDLWEYTNDGSSYSRIGSALMTVSDTPPASPYTGDLWFESDSGITFVRYDSHWIEIGASGIGAVTSDSPPSSPANGQIWFESDTNQLHVYYSGNWIQVGGSATVLGTIDAKGDLLVGTANDTVTRLGAGTNGSVLSANSATASGLEWVSRAAIVDDFAVASIMGAY